MVCCKHVNLLLHEKFDWQSLVTRHTCDLCLKQSNSKAAVGIRWCFNGMNSTGMFWWLPLLQPQLSAMSGALTPAFKHKQVLTGRRLMKLQFIVCTNPGHQKNRSENSSSLASFYFFSNKKYCKFSVLVVGDSKFHQLPAPGFLLPSFASCWTSV